MKKSKTAEEKTYQEQLEKEQLMLQEVSKRHNVAKVIQLKVPTNDEYTAFVYGYIKYPDRSDISIAMTMKDTDPLKGKEIVLRNSWLEGDESILNDTERFLSACTVLDEALAVRQALIKKNYPSGQ